MRHSDEQMRGRSIIAADGFVIGEISALFVDTSTWRIESIQATLRKETADSLGAHRSIFQAGTLEIPIHLVQSVGTTVVLTVPLDGLRAVMPNEQAKSPAHN
ncbi:MAG TPA: hypothetical protein VFZ73_13375 [Gemmatimonadaceae bacterium]